MLGIRFACEVELGDVCLCLFINFHGLLSVGAWYRCRHVLLHAEFTIQKTEEGRKQVIARENGISHIIRNRMLWQLRRDMSNPTLLWMAEEKLSGRAVTSKIRSERWLRVWCRGGQRVP